MTYFTTLSAGVPDTTSRVTTRFSVLKSKFLEELLRDLRRIGFRTRLQKVGACLRIGIQTGDSRSSETFSVIECEGHSRIRDRRFLAAAFNSGMNESFTSGEQVDVEKISPTLEFCAEDAQFSLFRFCRLLQTVAAPRLLYRQVAIIVRDAGQRSKPVIGIAGLASPVYSLRCRDHLFGWTNASSAVRNRGLLRCMNLAVCMAMPPYNHIRGAKLIAAMTASKEVADEYHRRYGAPLLAVVTTAARGLHTPIFNRIMLKPGGLYRRIGQTTGYSAVIFSERTIAAAKRLVVDRDGDCPATTDRPIRVLKRAMNLCGVPRERFMRLGIPKGVYAAWPNVAALSGLAQAHFLGANNWPTIAEAIAYWRSRELSRVVNRRRDVERFRSSGWSDIVQVLGGI